MGPVAGLFASERQQEILAIARRDGRVDVNELGRRFAVTTETIRRDLSKLERATLLRRVHGGAIPIERTHIIPTVAQRAVTMSEEKRAIMLAAVDEVPSAGALLIDAGTTTAALVEFFPDDREVTVVTNSLPVAEGLMVKPKVEVMMLGGRVREKTLATVDSWVLHSLEEVRVDVAMIAAYGVHPSTGLTTPSPAEAAVKRAMMDAALRVVVVADHSKLGNVHLSIFAPLTEVDVLITDQGADPEILKNIQDAGPEVRVAAGGKTSLAVTEDAEGEKGT